MAEFEYWRAVFHLQLVSKARDVMRTFSIGFPLLKAEGIDDVRLLNESAEEGEDLIAEVRFLLGRIVGLTFQEG